MIEDNSGGPAVYAHLRRAARSAGHRLGGFRVYYHGSSLTPEAAAAVGVCRKCPSLAPCRFTRSTTGSRRFRERPLHRTGDAASVRGGVTGADRRLARRRTSRSSRSGTDSSRLDRRRTVDVPACGGSSTPR
jgi:hypothetical protein